MGITLIGDEVFVADQSDRIIVFRKDGTFLRAFGRTGRGAGELKYPYGLCAVGSTLFVCEYGNHRIQRFDRAGRSQGWFGGPGDGPEQFSGPWDIAASSDDRRPRRESATRLGLDCREPRES